MNARLLEALDAIHVAELSYSEWINVGMALHAEGADCSVWDEWSKNDKRYHDGECARKWKSFHGNQISGGTIIYMAKARGWKPPDGTMGWDAVILKDYGKDGTQMMETSKKLWELSSVEQVETYMKAVFKKSDKVSYVTTDSWMDDSGKWLPGIGNYDRTAGELLASLAKYPDDLAMTFGDWKTCAGAWIRFNPVDGIRPVDGSGVDDTNVVRYDYTLVECDDIPVKEQYELYIKLQLPIICLVYSGNKSMHAITHIDAANKKEFQERVEFLYSYLQKHGVPVDTQNKNPSRLSRMPGVTRNGKQQSLIAVNIGRKSWDDWIDFINSGSDNLAEVPTGDVLDEQPEEMTGVLVDSLTGELSDGSVEKKLAEPTDASTVILPPMVSLSSYVDNPPFPPKELISGILRCSHKMLISGSSKAGKSFLLMELTIAIAEGTNWLGFSCKKGRVLYVNLEIDSASCIGRFLKIYKALGIEPKHVDDISIWNLRGYALPLDELVPELVSRVRGQYFDAVILDPLYKLMGNGDENNASQMAAFCNEFDKICTQTGSAVIYCHHHSKGLQGSKRAIDRASGSGVFARDPDAQLDMIQLKLPKEPQDNACGEKLTAWRLESSLREFPNITPVNFYFSYPIHKLDETGELMMAAAEGSSMANLFESDKYTTKDERRRRLDSAYEDCGGGEPGKQVKVSDMAASADVDDKTIRRWIREFGDDYQRENGVVNRIVKS